MASAGSVTIDFAAETAKFTAEMKKVRSELKSLRDQVTGISGQFERAAGAFKKAFAALAVGTAIRAVVKATSESEEAVARLNNALRSTNAIVGPASDRFQSFASQMQRLTTFSDESVLSVSTLLLSFKGLSGQTVLNATSAVLDLSTRMGVDLRGAALAVGKALQDPAEGLTALRRMGLSFSDAQKEVIKRLVETGDRAKAQELILAELEKRFGGAAREARDTFGGALAGVKNAFDDLLEAKGGLPGATTALNNLSATLASPEIKKGFDALIGGITKIIELAAKAVTGIANLGSQLGRLFASRTIENNGLTAAQALTAELVKEQRRLAELENLPAQSKRLKRIQNEITAEKAYIETLRQRIRFAELAQPKRDFLKALVPAADSIIGGITGGATSATDFVTGGGSLEGDGPAQALLKQQSEILKTFQKQRDETNQIILEQTRAQLEEDLKLSTEFGLQKLEQEQLTEAQRQEFLRRSREEQIAGELNMQETILDFQLQAANAAVGLLQALGAKNKAFAAAALAFETAIAVKRILIQGQVAAMAALTPPPIGLGPVAGAALAAKIIALSRVSAALTAATGLAQIGQTLSSDRGGIGGTALGTPANPIVTRGGLGDGIAEETQSQNAINIHINGFISKEVIRDLMDQLEDKFKRGAIIISGGTNQANAIRGGGN